MHIGNISSAHSGFSVEFSGMEKKIWVYDINDSECM